MKAWTVHLVVYGNNEQIFCYDSHISLNKLCQTALEVSELELLEQISCLLGIKLKAAGEPVP